jgi:hypothetical protein
MTVMHQPRVARGYADWQALFPCEIKSSVAAGRAVRYAIANTNANANANAKGTINTPADDFVAHRDGVTLLRKVR